METNPLEKCPFEDDCIDKGVKCSTCRHNPNTSHYEPKFHPWKKRWDVPESPFWSSSEPSIRLYMAEMPRGL